LKTFVKEKRRLQDIFEGLFKSDTVIDASADAGAFFKSGVITRWTAFGDDAFFAF
jgi:hypothetical protein